MAKHYSIKSFFRNMPNQLLERFFKQKGLFKKIKFEKMKEGNPDELVTAWLTLPDHQRSKLDTECREIFEMCCEKGVKAIIDEARWQYHSDENNLSAFIEMLSGLPNHFHRAMTTYLDHIECWKGATRFYHADTLPYWRKRKNMGHNAAGVDDKSVNKLIEKLKILFHFGEARGKNCAIETFRRGELDYFFCYPEDYSKQSIEWVDGEFGPRPHNPALEIIYVYSQKEGTLDLNFRGSRLLVEPLQGIFANAILKIDELQPDPKDLRIYDLNKLANNNFSFTYPAGSGIERVAVSKLRFSSRVKSGEKIIVEANTSKDEYEIYKLINKINQAVRLDSYNVTQADILALVSLNPNQQPKNVRIRVTHPNSCSLRYDELDLKLRAMLFMSGIEPLDPS